MLWRYSRFLFLIVLGLGACENESALTLESENQNPVERLPYYDTPDFDPLWEVPNDQELHTVFDFELTDQNGVDVNQTWVEDKIYISNFFFTRCGGICPKMMENMAYLQEELNAEPDVLFLSHSVLPETDDSEQLKIYGNNFGVNDEKWRLLTGDKTQIYDLARKGYFAEEEMGYTKDSTEFLHTEHFILVDKDRHIRGIYNGTIKLEMDRILEDVKLLIAEA